MALDLTSTITADADELRVTGTVPAAFQIGTRFRLDAEMLRIRKFGSKVVSGPNIPGNLTVRDTAHWYVARGEEGSVPASHTSGADIRAVDDAFASSDDTTPPGPFAAGGSGIPQGGPLTGNLDAGNYGITSLVDPTDGQDAATKAYVDDTVGGIPQGGPLEEDLDADGYRINGLADPQSDQDAATKAYVDAASAASPYRVARVQLSDAQIKTLRATEVEIVDAPGVGKAIWIVSVNFVLDMRNGVYDFTDAELDFGFEDYWLNTLSTWFDIYPDAAELFVSFVSSSTPANFPDVGSEDRPTGIFDRSVIENTALCFGNTGASEIAGGGAGNTLSAEVTYQIVDVVPFAP